MLEAKMNGRIINNKLSVFVIDNNKFGEATATLEKVLKTVFLVRLPNSPKYSHSRVSYY